MGMVRLNDYNMQFSTNTDGQLIFNIIKPLLGKGDIVTIDFKGVRAVPSSFVNTAFIQLLDYFSFDYIKKHLKLVNIQKFNGQLIKESFAFESRRKKNHALAF